MKKVFAILVAIACAASPVCATENADRIAEIKQQIAELQKELISLSSESNYGNVEGIQPDPGVIYDGNGLTISTTNYELEKGNLTIGLLYENQSSINRGIMPRGYAINGLMVGENAYGFGSVDVASGKKATTKISASDDILKKYPVSGIQSLDFFFWIYDNAKNYKEFSTDGEHIGAENTKPINGIQIYDQNGIQIDFISHEGDKYTYGFWNETGNYLSFSAENITVNDFTLEMPFNTTPYEQIVLNKCQGLFTIELDEETLEGAGITSVEKLEYTLHVQPLESYSDDWDTELMGDIVEPEFLY